MGLTIIGVLPEEFREWRTFIQFEPWWFSHLPIFSFVETHSR
jgi:hypothetical protein